MSRDVGWGEDEMELAERCHTDSCDHVRDLETRVQEVLRANGELAMLWTQDEDRINALVAERSRLRDRLVRASNVAHDRDHPGEWERCADPTCASDRAALGLAAWGCATVGCILGKGHAGSCAERPTQRLPPGMGR